MPVVIQLRRGIDAADDVELCHLAVVRSRFDRQLLAQFEARTDAENIELLETASGHGS